MGAVEAGHLPDLPRISSEFANQGRLFRSEEDEEVVVRYSPPIARWIREKPWEAEEREDGSVVVRHDVADAA